MDSEIDEELKDGTLEKIAIISAMSKQPHNSQAPAPASEDLVQRLQAAANDVELVRKIVESSDSVSISAAIVALLSGVSSSAANGSELRKKARNRPCPLLPEETFLEVMLFADRDTLDTMQFVCSFLLNFIRERELTQLALRAISRVRIGQLHDYEAFGDIVPGWLPTIEMDYKRGAGKELAPKTIHQLASCLRMSYCELVYIYVGTIDETNSVFSDAWAMVFDDLVAPSTFVGTLYISLPRCDVELALRGIVAFKSVKTVNVDAYEHADQEPLDENFFLPAAQRGVRHLTHSDYTWGEHDMPANTVAALSFGFAEPTTGGDRSLCGTDCDIGKDFLAQVKQKAGELCEARHVDFSFELAVFKPLQIDSTGFEKYQRDDGRTWLMSDLDNHVNVEVTQTEGLITIHVFSSI
ncbi:hypothetical protein AAVH_12576 [Aphelenchoides avenae]|nr:hypothetical protein AAVH_12576 [Aphelenchus avenae]